MRLIVTNDDFAATFGFSEGIKKAFLNGITTCASIETNGPAFAYSVKLLKTSLKKICLGVHLNLNHGKGYAEELVDQNGDYKYSVFHYFFLFQKPDQKFLQAIAKDLDNQIQKVFQAKLKPVFLSGHNHIHLVPPIFEIVCNLCHKYNIKYIRLPREPFYLIPSLAKNISSLILNRNLARFLLIRHFVKHNLPILQKYKLKTTDAFYGILYTNHMDSSVIQYSILHALKQGFDSVEILGHPALRDKRDTVFTCKFMAKYSQSKERSIETKAFQDPKIKTLIKRHNIKLISFSEL